MQNGLTFSVEISPKSTFEIDLALQKLGCREKCETVFEKKKLSTQTPFRTFHETLLNKQSGIRFGVTIREFSLGT